MKKQGVCLNESGQGLTEYITLILLIAVCRVEVTSGLAGLLKPM